MILLKWIVLYASIYASDMQAMDTVRPTNLMKKLERVLASIVGRRQVATSHTCHRSSLGVALVMTRCASFITTLIAAVTAASMSLFCTGADIAVSTASTAS